MKKVSILEKIEKAGIIAVIRGTKKQAYQSVKSCVNGGVKGIELTFTVPEADKIIAQIKEEYDSDPEVCIGAGTVLDVSTAKLAISAGALFIVAPTFNKEVAKLCNLYQVPYIPGCMTVTEIQTALMYGADIIKVFPGSVVGKDFIAAVKAPLPQVNIMPTGGVNLDNMQEWFNAGALVVGTGGNLVGPSSNGDYAKVEQNARAYHEKFVGLKKISN
ncbi:bifunctional 2-keto-4-hydroxyglutarate aldolase/2-keto-3-deoxy-6-phosphogluconate aldolase [Lactobacillus sp. UCMA15818]|uniref:bifunctional 2-keto-4-hydroxyglutarate aldolase/2-keto-3-deoxy-6-phosphogluconate aldolase n=1 Tax=Lactobacillus sp. UCMA15818 TaxID=2583394 RepID=UPI0025AEFDFE|nr:bifunctional 2-keto-4-hydroxyglutarate aldolase/2-keto-3-deoxy-6-phosphogluconate aldolase [Lactobacillus sp. UCMA15818]MDN2453157.1 bifunctional 4-hydroxy-2-oxoglutarate aldolase/2-dehydro-3-deoxy-phosphogluconate aldolase [Lactobacillus sp. UCMA15818]